VVAGVEAEEVELHSFQFLRSVFRERL